MVDRVISGKVPYPIGWVDQPRVTQMIPAESWTWFGPNYDRVVFKLLRDACVRIAVNSGDGL